MYTTVAKPTSATPWLRSQSIATSVPRQPVAYSQAARYAAIGLPAEASQVRAARRFTTDQLLHWGVRESDRDRAELIVSELAGNAARHGGTEMSLHISLVGEELRIDTTDSGRSANSRALSKIPSDESGRGLQLVGLIADRVAIRPQPQGWQVCVGLRLSPFTDS